MEKMQLFVQLYKMFVACLYRGRGNLSKHTEVSQHHYKLEVIAQ